MLVNSIPKTI